MIQVCIVTESLFRGHAFSRPDFSSRDGIGTGLSGRYRFLLSLGLGSRLESRDAPSYRLRLARVAKCGVRGSIDKNDYSAY